MELTGDRHHQIEEALLSAFPSMDALQRMVRHELNINLNAISSGRNLRDVVFNLIQWAESRGQLEALLRGARAVNPGNPQLSEVVSKIDIWSMGKRETIEVIELISSAKKSGSPSIDLSNRNLTELPEEIYFTETLVALNLSGNSISSLSPLIKTLPNLEVLTLSGNRLYELPDEFSNLKKLRLLSLSNNPLTTVPFVVTNLQSLELIDMSNTRLATIPRELYRLFNLQTLNLGQNNIRDIPPGMKALTKLSSLNLSQNNLDGIPFDLGYLGALRELNLSHNHLSMLPPQFSELSLTELNLSDNQFTSFPYPLLGLKSLTYLNLSQNYLTDLPLAIIQLVGLREINLEHNPFAQDVEILGGSREPRRIFAFLKEQAKNRRSPINETKLILVGEGSVGKTSLVNRLLDRPFDDTEFTTKEINIEPWLVDCAGRKIKVNIWDFGGQEKMHAAHQFFLTKRSVYILVLDSRISEKANRVEYWLKLIRNYAGASPIIVVCNKADQHQIDLDWRYLEDKYGVTEFVRRCSCSDGEGINELKDILAKIITELPHVSELIPESWLAVKSRVEHSHADFISYDDFRKMAQEEGIEDDTTSNTLLQYLHDLGAILWFWEDMRLSDTNVINPLWLTHAVYAIINSETLTKQYGKVKVSQLLDILDAKTYAKKIPFIIDAMKRFELCFPIDCPDGECILVPDLLSNQQLETNNWSDYLPFEIRYQALPSSVICRLIVRMHSLSPGNSYWRTGIFLTRNDVRALVRSDEMDSKIEIRVTGPKDERRRFLESLRLELRLIHDSLPEISPTEWVPIPNTNSTVSYDQLIQNEKFGIEKFVPPGMNQPIFVAELLEGVDPPEKRTGFNLAEPRKFTDPIPVKLLSRIQNLTDYIIRFPALNPYEARSSLLVGISGASTLNRSTINAQVDLITVFDQIWNREMQFDAQHPISIIIENILPFAGGTETSWGKELLDLRSQIEAVYKEL